MIFLFLIWELLIKPPINPNDIIKAGLTKVVKTDILSALFMDVNINIKEIIAELHIDERNPFFLYVAEETNPPHKPDKDKHKKENIFAKSIGFLNFRETAEKIKLRMSKTKMFASIPNSIDNIILSLFALLFIFFLLSIIKPLFSFLLVKNMIREVFLEL